MSGSVLSHDKYIRGTLLVEGIINCSLGLLIPCGTFIRMAFKGETQCPNECVLESVRAGR